MSEALDSLSLHLVVLQAQCLELLVLVCCQSLGDLQTTTGGEETVTNPELEQRRPTWQAVGKSGRSNGSESVVLQIQDLKARCVVETLGQQVRNTLLANSVLGHLNRLEADRVGLVSPSPCLHAAIFQAVAPADNALEQVDRFLVPASFLLARS